MDTSDYLLEPQGQCSGTIQVPGDKSISHRVVMLGSVAEGTTHVSGFLSSTDCMATIEAFQAMGVSIEQSDSTEISIRGVELNGLNKPNSELNMQNSGTAMRLMAGLLCGQKFATRLVGDTSLSSRPMQRIQKPLQKMGANITLHDNDTAPINIQPAETLTGIHYQLPIASAQVKSSVLLAGMYAQGKTCVKEKNQTRDHTERMLQTFSYPLEMKDNTVCLTGGHKLVATDINIPGDISSAAFFIVGALISNSVELIVENIGINPTRNGVIEVLQMMGANIEIRNQRTYGAEPVADLVIRSSDLHGIEIPKSLIAKTIDEFPILFIAAACAKGKTVLRGAEELRVKESDRIHNMVVGLQALGISVEEHEDGLTVFGGPIAGGVVDSNSDHRIAMSFAMASIVSQEPIHIKNIENVATSFPDFVVCASRLGLKFK